MEVEARRACSGSVCGGYGGARNGERLPGCGIVMLFVETGSLEKEYWVWWEWGQEAHFGFGLLKCGFLVVIAAVKAHVQVQQIPTEYLQYARHCASFFHVCPSCILTTTLWKDIITVPCLQMEELRLREVRWLAVV